mmetsp:Transcript_10745/g.12301  ORF Transcript_10745/g.12301 Transcript_10745/m.12301 type:complete len:233 (+) Transcript_10745:139-837(+)
MTSQAAITTEELQKEEQTAAPFNRTKRRLSGWWDSKEHKRFLDGLNQHGRDWKKIADVVQTRTPVQVRTHAQKFFMRPENDRLYPKSETLSPSTLSGTKRDLETMRKDYEKETLADSETFPGATKLLQPFQGFVTKSILPSKFRKTNSPFYERKRDISTDTAPEANGFFLQGLFQAETIINNSNCQRMVSYPEQAYICEAEALLSIWAEEEQKQAGNESQLQIPFDENLLAF